MHHGFQRALLRLAVVLGVVLCLSPFAAQTRLTWRIVVEPIFAAARHDGPLDKDQIEKLRDPAELKRAYVSDPWFLGTTFVVAPIGLALIAGSMKRLRRPARPPGPGWPADYRPGAAP